MKKVDLLSDITKRLGESTGAYYDKMLYNSLMNNSIEEMMYGNIVGYRNVKVPKYFKIKIPIIEKHTDYDDDYCESYDMGWLIRFKEVKLFRIGTTIEEEPIRRKPKNRTIKWVRYSSTKPKVSRAKKNDTSGVKTKRKVVKS